jgi:signal transduction histidine kinase
MVVYSPVTIGVRDAIQSVIGLVRESANKKNISVILDIPPVMRVIADPNMFESMIRNLVFNAVKFTPRGGSVTISSKMINGSFAELSVRDTGIGMNRMMIDKLFQHDNQTQRKGTEGEPSTGLGLVIFKGLIEKHGGTIRVESEEGAGSNFIFTLPADQSYPLT